MTQNSEATFDNAAANATHGSAFTSAREILSTQAIDLMMAKGPGVKGGVTGVSGRLLTQDEVGKPEPPLKIVGKPESPAETSDKSEHVHQHPRRPSHREPFQTVEPAWKTPGESGSSGSGGSERTRDTEKINNQNNGLEKLNDKNKQSGEEKLDNFDKKEKGHDKQKIDNTDKKEEDHDEQKIDNNKEEKKHDKQKIDKDKLEKNPDKYRFRSEDGKENQVDKLEQHKKDLDKKEHEKNGDDKLERQEKAIEKKLSQEKGIDKKDNDEVIKKPHHGHGGGRKDPGVLKNFPTVTLVDNGRAIS